MRIKTIITATLLTFAFASAAYLVFGELRDRREPEKSAAHKNGGVRPVSPADARSASGESGSPAERSESEARLQEIPEDGLIVYYFHGNWRCAKCKTIERYTKQAIESEFTRELEKGTLVWRPVNVDVGDNRRYVSRFQLSTRTVVLVRIEDRKEGRWKKLEKVWDLVSDRPAFLRYIQDEVKESMDDI